MTLANLNHPKSPPISTLFHIFIEGEHTDFKSSAQVDHIKSQPTDNKLSLKGAWL